MASSRPSRPQRGSRFITLVVVAALMLSGSAGYTVKAGDTLWDIAARLGVSASALAARNGISNPNYIRPGQTLSVPSRRSATSSTSASTATAKIHVVAPGETLMGISIKYGVLMKRIAAANGFSDLQWVYAGQRLRIPAGQDVATGSSTAPSAAPAPAAASVSSSSADVERLLEQTASRYGFSASFIKAIAYQESGWNQSARSSVGAVGVMQVMPDTGTFISTYLVGRPLDITQTEDNITAGVAYVAYLWRLTGGDTRKTLAGYYQGLASVADNGMYPSTHSYIANILALRDRF